MTFTSTQPLQKVVHLKPKKAAIQRRLSKKHTTDRLKYTPKGASKKMPFQAPTEIPKEQMGARAGERLSILRKKQAHR